MCQHVVKGQVKGATDRVEFYGTEGMRFALWSCIVLVGYNMLTYSTWRGMCGCMKRLQSYKNSTVSPSSDISSLPHLCTYSSKKGKTHHDWVEVVRSV